MNRIAKLLRSAVLLPVRFYRRFISPALPPSCRFTPSCSQYCIEAVEEWGIICGLALSAWRIIRCNPWSRGGYDPVPKRNRKKKIKNDKTKEIE